jgi:hypothetical protein
MKTNDDWEWADDYKVGFATTDDPRVLAVIQRDDYAQISELYDGDAINPILYRERGRAHWVAGYDDGSAETINWAFEQWDDDTAERYLWIFHGIVFSARRAPGDYDGEYLVVCSRKYLEHIGNVPALARADAEEDLIAISTDLQYALDGHVYGIGYAVFAERVTDEEDVDIDLFDIEMQCWGFVGEEYAKSEAAAMYEEPDLPALLEFPEKREPEPVIERTVGGEW